MRAHVVRVGPQGHAIELFVSEPQAMVAVADEVEVLTLDNLAALEVRKPQVDAEVIARTQGALIGWQNADEFDTEELQEHGDVLRDATRALLAAVEAAPCEATSTCGRLSADFEVSGTEYPSAPDAKHRFAEWCGENFAAIWYEFSLLRDELGLPQPECDEEASGSDPAPAPDFAAMDPDNLSLVEVQALRDWLDERGQRSTWNSVEFDWSARLCDDSGKEIARTVDHFDETEALLALCQAVAAKEAGA